MPLSQAPREWNEGRYGEWSYGGKPLVPRTGGGMRSPATALVTTVPEVAVSTPRLMNPANIPELGLSGIPPLINPNNIPKAGG